MNHHSEVSMDIYQSASQNGALFIESQIGIQTELQGLQNLINGEIGEVIDGRKSAGRNYGKSVFQSMGNALEDGVMANLIYQKYIKL
jgi:ornithine cyclodeaminase/alanine dehydrogenase-like protein (mu-crystallin family)